MKVQIEGKLYLESDDRNFILKEYYTVKEGKNAGEEGCTIVGYFSTINHALMAFMKMKIKESTAGNLFELIEDVRRIELYIRQKFELDIGGERKAV